MCSREKEEEKMSVTVVFNLTAGALRHFLPPLNAQTLKVLCGLQSRATIKHLQCTRINLSGQFTRNIGQDSQTLQCIVSGQAVGTFQLKSKVVRDLAKLFCAKCLASKRLYDKLMQLSL